MLQLNLKSYNIYLYFLSSEITSFPQGTYLISKINIYDSKSQEYTIKLNISDQKGNYFQCIYPIEEEKDKELYSLIEEKGEKNLRLVVNYLNFFGEEEENGNGNIRQFYNFDIHLGEYADSQKQSFDFSNLFNYDYDYITKIYKIKEASSCTSDYYFNLTLDKEIEVNETKKINLVFKGNKGKKTITINTECSLSNLNNIIVCQSDEETKDLNYNMEDYLFINENELLSITADNDLTFHLYCYEEPPIEAIIVLAVVFIFVLIVVIIVIIFINKKGRGEQGYDAPNISNSNNIIGFSSGGLSK